MWLYFPLFCGWKKKSSFHHVLFITWAINSRVLHLLHRITTHIVNIQHVTLQLFRIFVPVFFYLHKYHLLIKVIKPSTSHRNNLDGTPEVTSQNSSFNYLIIRIIIVIIIALMVTFLCIIRKLIMELSCFAVGRSYPSFNACYLLFGALLWGTTYSFTWPHN